MAPGRFGDDLHLVDQRSGRGQLTAEDPRSDVRAQGEREHGQRAGLTDHLYLSNGELVPTVVVPHLYGCFFGEPEPAERAVRDDVAVSERVDGPLEERRSSRA